MPLQLTDSERDLCKQVGRHYRQFYELLEQLRLAELERAIKGREEDFRTYKGRVQFLTDLQQAMAPDAQPAGQKS